jgi:hypothetical protein
LVIERLHNTLFILRNSYKLIGIKIEQFRTAAQ